MNRSIEIIDGRVWIRTTDESGSVSFEPSGDMYNPHGFQGWPMELQEQYYVKLEKLHDESEDPREANAHTEKPWNRR